LAVFPAGAIMNSAIASLVERHNQVLDWFELYNAADSNVRKQELASKICRDLQAQIARGRGATDHVMIAQLTEEVLKSSPIDELFDSKVRILGAAFAQHVESEFQ
jgi:hypothetical protein